LIGSDIKLADFGYNEKFRIANNSKKYLKGPMFCQKGPVLHLLGGEGWCLEESKRYYEINK
jgi:hypothetical protein